LILLHLFERFGRACTYDQIRAALDVPDDASSRRSLKVQMAWIRRELAPSWGTKHHQCSKVRLRAGQGRRGRRMSPTLLLFGAVALLALASIIIEALNSKRPPW
jgi:hypothetical protein